MLPTEKIRAVAAGLARGGLMLLVMGLVGCSELAYYWQAGQGQLEILRKRRSIEEVLADEAVPKEVKAKLSLVLDVRAYGEQALAMPVGEGFKYYADLGREYVSWIVVASEPYAIKEYKHCYLIVGCLGYRGFFKKRDADDFSQGLAGEGYDVFVRPVRAYSTLGWFDDPVLSTYIHSGDLRLVATIIHEQAHAILFVKGDTDFNESFSTFVEEQGVKLFLSNRGEAGKKQLVQYYARKKEERLFRQIVLKGRERLEGMYEKPMPMEKRVVEKARLFELLRQDYQKEKSSFKILSHDAWFEQELNNAHLVGIQQYHSWVPAFKVLFEQEEGDFLRFYRAVEKLAELPQEERETRLKTLEEKNIAKY